MREKDRGSGDNRANVLEYRARVLVIGRSSFSCIIPAIAGFDINKQAVSECEHADKAICTQTIRPFLNLYKLLLLNPAFQFFTKHFLMSIPLGRFVALRWNIAFVSLRVTACSLIRADMVWHSC